MADIRYFFIETGETPEVFSYGGKCWKKLVRTRSTGEVVPYVNGIFASTEECICDSGNTTPDPVIPVCSNQLLNVQALTSYARDYSPLMHDLVTIGPVTYKQNINLGSSTGSIHFENSSQNDPAYLTMDNSSSGYSYAPDLPGDYSIQYWIKVIGIPHQNPNDGTYLGVILDGRAVGITSNNNELIQYVQREGDGYRLAHGSTTEQNTNLLVSNLLEYDTNYQVVISRKDGVEKMYVTGEFHNERNSSISYNNKNLVIGQHAWNLHSDVNYRLGFVGYLQDLRIFNIATHYCSKHTVDVTTPEQCNSWVSVHESIHTPAFTPHVLIQAGSIGNNYWSGIESTRRQKIYIDGVEVLNASPYRGMLISKLREVNGTWELVEHFGDTQDFHIESNVDQAQTLLQSFEDGEMLVLTTFDEPYASGYTSRLFDELQTFGAANSQYSALNYYGSSYILISIKGMLPNKQGYRFFWSEGSNGGGSLGHTVYL